MDNTEYLKELAAAEKRAKQTELEQAKAAALKSIETEQAATMPTYTAQKQQASTASQIGAKNLAEYWANRGQTQAGISQQAELSRQNTLAGSLGTIGTNEATALTGFNTQKGTAETSYQSGLANAYNTVDTNLQTNLYNEKVRQQEAAETERVRLANLEAEKQAAYRDAAIASQAKAASAAEDAANAEVATDYYVGNLNSDVKNGTFATTDSRGVRYQPNNIGGNKLSKTGYSGEVNGVVQNIWTYTDKNGNTRYAYWDGTKNQYFETSNPSASSADGKANAKIVTK